MTSHIRLLALLALLLAVTTLAACTDGDESSATSQPEASGAAGDGLAPTTGDGPAAPVTSPPAPEEPTTLAELEQQWAQARASAVERLTSDELGVGADGVLRGPGGLEVDLGDCPAGWSDTGGLDGDTITMAHTSATSGPFARFGNLTTGTQLYFDHVNSEGGVAGRQLELVVADDGYEPSRTEAVVADLLAADPFLLTTMGTLQTLSVYDAVNEACVPHPFVVANGHPAWSDPRSHPFTTGLRMSYPTEAQLWGAWIAGNIESGRPLRVAALVEDSYVGTGFLDSFEHWMKQHPDVVGELSVVELAIAAPPPTDELAAVAEGGADVVLSMTTLATCGMALDAAVSVGLTGQQTVIFTPNECRVIELYLEPLGAGADGVLSLTGGVVEPDPDPEGVEDDLFLRFVDEQLVGAEVDTADRFFATGFGLYGWAQVEALRIAAELPGGLSRSNLLLALWGMDLRHPMLVEGVGFASDGPEDPDLVEGSAVEQFDATAQAWVALGDVVDVNGTTPRCDWVDGGCD